MRQRLLTLLLSVAPSLLSMPPAAPTARGRDLDGTFHFRFSDTECCVHILPLVLRVPLGAGSTTASADISPCVFQATKSSSQCGKRWAALATAVRDDLFFDVMVLVSR